MARSSPSFRRRSGEPRRVQQSERFDEPMGNESCKNCSCNLRTKCREKDPPWGVQLVSKPIFNRNPPHGQTSTKFRILLANDFRRLPVEMEHVEQGDR